jgi:hypothetical protein
MGVNIDVDLDLSGLEGQIQRIKREIKSIEDDIDIDIDDIEVVDKTGDGDGGGDGSDQDRVGLMNRLKRNMDEFNLGEFISNSQDDGILDGVLDDINTSDSRILPGPSGDMTGAERADGSNKGPLGALNFGFLDRGRETGLADFSTRDLRDSDYNIQSAKEAVETHREGRGATYRFSQAMDGLSDSFSKARSTFQKVKPSLGKIYALIALLLPLIITTGAELIGLAAAFGGLAAAGGAAVALGFLGGEADTLSGSLQNAKEKANDLKKELFQIIQPTADRLAPVSDAAIRETKAGVRDLVSNLDGLRQAGYFVVSAIRPSLNLIGELFQTVLNYAPQLAEIFGGFGQMISENASNFLAGIIEYTIKSIPKLKRLFALFSSLAKVVFSLAGIASSFVSVFALFAPLFNLLANILGNEFVKGFAKFLALLSIGVGALAAFGTMLQFITGASLSLGGVMGWLTSTAIGGFLVSVYQAIAALPVLLAELTAMQAVLWSAAAAMAVLTGGLAVLGAGILGNALMPEMGVDNPGSGGSGGFGSGGMSGGPGGSTTINVYGDVDNATQEDLRTKVGRANSEFGKMRGDL